MNEPSDAWGDPSWSPDPYADVPHPAESRRAEPVRRRSTSEDARATRVYNLAKRSPRCRVCREPLTQGQAGIHASCSTDPVPQREAWPDEFFTSARKAKDLDR